jgi:quinol-cytochrome oxidoreductase complex cytochrome b subunit
MWRLRALRILLVLFGLIFVAGVYPLITSVRSGWLANKEDAEPMGLSLYVTMGIFLLLAARNPSANRGVITFAAWLNIAHAAVMSVMAVHLPNERQDLLIASAVFACIGAVLILLAPAKASAEPASVAGA